MCIRDRIEGERARQIELIEEGKAVVQETRRWDDNKEYSYAMRSKEDAKDYRYFPDPDLPPVHISDEWIDRIVKSMPEFQPEKQARYVEPVSNTHLAEGIEFVTNADIGKDVKADKLLKEFDRVLLCCGAANPRDIKAEGRDAKGIYFAVDFLTSVCLLYTSRCV